MSAVDVTLQVDTLSSTTLSLLSTGYSLTDSTLTIPANALIFRADLSARQPTTDCLCVDRPCG